MVVVVDFMLEGSVAPHVSTCDRVLGEDVALCLFRLVPAVKISSAVTASAVLADVERMGYYSLLE